MMRRPNRIIVAQSTPPRGLSLMGAAELLGKGRRAIAAQVIELVVARRVELRGMTGRRGFVLRLVDDTDLEPDSAAVVRVLFPRGVGSTRHISRRSNRRLSSRLRAPHRAAARRLIDLGLARRRGPLAAILHPRRRQSIAPMREAEPLIDNLFGLYDYIRLVEQDRFRMLHSPDRAERAPQSSPSDDGTALDRYRLTERLLPWAVLFGLEREWSRRLALYAKDAPATSDPTPLLDLDPGTFDLLQIIGDLDGLADALEGVGTIVFAWIGAVLDT